MEFIRAKHEVRHALVISEPTPVGNVQNMWGSVGQAATVGIFLMLFVAFLYLGRAILLPVLAAAVIALTLAPLVKMLARAGISPWITGLFILLIGFGAMSLLGMALAGPVSNWISQAPQIGAAIQQKLSVLDQPLAALHQLEGSLFGNGAAQVSVSAPNVVLPVVAFLTPAAGEVLLFFVTLYFFLVGQMRIAQSGGQYVHQPRFQAAIFENHARHRTQSGRLSHRRHDHQCRGRHHCRRRRLAHRLAQPGDLRRCWRRF